MHKIELKATTAGINRVTDFVNDILTSAGCPTKVMMQVDIVIDEMFSNIVRYAYGDIVGMASVSVELTDEPRGVVITFTDTGKPFDPLQQEEPDVTLSAEERRIGGLGIFIVKKTMDDVSYDYKDGKNILTIRKYF